MKFDVVVPPSGEHFRHCEVVKFHKKNETIVKSGETIATLENDKISMELEAEYSGILIHKVGEGSKILVGETLAIIDDEGVSISDLNASPFVRLEAEGKTGSEASVFRVAWLSLKLGLIFLGLYSLYEMVFV